jgi:hypothetical protein
MPPKSPLLTSIFALAFLAAPASATVHIWEKQELTFTSARSFLRTRIPM